MKPSEIHALPAEQSSHWFESPGTVIEDVFGYRDEELDLEKASDAGAIRIGIERKLMETDGDLEAWVTVSSLLFNSRPFGIHTQAGGGSSVRITDWNTFQEARDYLEGWHRRPVLNHAYASPDEDDPSITDQLGLRAMTVRGKTMLVSERFLDAEGSLILDPAAWREAFNRLLLQQKDGKEAGLRDPYIRARTVEALLAAVPEGVEAAGLDRKEENGAWTAIVVATDEGTYAFGIPPHAAGAKWLSWAGALDSARIGGPEAIEDYRETAAPSP
jgi:hypothetical protein